MMKYIRIEEESVKDAENEARKRKNHLEKLLNKTGTKGLTLEKPEPYDGDCLFHSIFNRIGIEKNVSDTCRLRKQLVDFFHSESCSRNLLATIDDEFLSEVAQNYRDVQDDHVLKGLTEMLHVAITVFVYDPSDDSFEELS